MVMDASPSPQSVGREFVRQYYTLLNKAPNHLHRFYNNSSSFVHGGLDQHNREAPIVVGQKQIHNKIQQLNFRDCHAKISQVDSQATLGNGVVVQVTGELSNDGQPMRRFTQTFVLAAQSPKKYYVHNDIFRYQDMYSDEEIDGESGRSENDDTEDTETIETTPIIGPQPTIFYPLAVPPTGQNVTIQTFTHSSQMNGIVHDEIIQGIPGQIQPILQSSPAAPQQLPDNSIALDTSPSTNPASIPSGTILPIVELKEPIIIETPIKLNENTIAVTPDNIANEKEPIEQPKPDKIEIVKEEAIKQSASEPKTYANLVKSGTSELSFASAMSSLPPMNSSGRLRQSTLSPPLRFHQDDQRRNDTHSGGSSGQQQLRQRPMNRERRSSNANSQNFGDHHQLFLGNLPHHATEDELKNLFSKFGTVADLRIHSKPGPKVGPGARAPPNYGFITYEDPESVQNCLANTPLHYPDPEGQKLNIEEKKTRSRVPNDGGGMSNNMRGNNGPPSRSMGGLSIRGVTNSGSGGMSRGGGSGGRDGGRGGGRGGFNNRSERGGSSITRTGGGGSGSGGGGNNSSNSNNNYGRR